MHDALWRRYRGEELPPVGPWNDVIEGLLGHRSVRAYLPDPLPAGTLETLIAAAQSAASSSNLQMWDVVAVENPERKARLSMMAGDQRHIREAPLFLVWIADLSRAEAMAAVAGKQVDAIHYLEIFMVAMLDAALAAQNAVVAAESLGLGTVYIGGVRDKVDQVAEELALPPRAFGVFGLAVGYPDPARPAGVKPRLPQRAVVHREQFRPGADLEAVAAYDACMKVFQRERQMAEIGWTRAVLSRLRNAESLHGRERLRELLGDLGFLLR